MSIFDQYGAFYLVEESAYVDITSVLANLLAGKLAEPLALITLGDFGNNERHDSSLSLLF